jgi:hypothetical protein
MRRETAHSGKGMTPEERAVFLEGKLDATRDGKLAKGTGVGTEAEPGLFARGTGQREIKDLSEGIDDDFDDPTQVDVVPAGLSTNDIFDREKDTTPLTLEGIKAEDEIIGITEGLDQAAVLSATDKKTAATSKMKTSTAKPFSPADHRAAGLERRAKSIDKQLAFAEETRANMEEIRASVIDPNKAADEAEELKDLRAIRASIFKSENPVKLLDEEIRSGFQKTSELSSGIMKSVESVKQTTKERLPETEELKNSRQMMENAITAYIKLYAEYDPKSVDAIYAGKKNPQDLVAAHDLAAITAPPLRAVFSSKGRELRDFYNQTQKLMKDYNNLVEANK